jgi:hypothetical protein
MGQLTSIKWVNWSHFHAFWYSFDLGYWALGLFKADIFSSVEKIRIVVTW